MAFVRGKRRHLAAGSVILAAGGFVMNADMVASTFRKLAEKPFVLGTPYDDGTGIELGLSAGGTGAAHGPGLHHRAVLSAGKLLTGIIVNRDGKRFVAEDSYHSRTSGFVLDQPG